MKKVIKNYEGLLSSAPPANLMKSHPYAKVEKIVNGAKMRVPYTYLPIDAVQNYLDSIFGVDGWKTANYRFHSIANEIVGHIELSVRFQYEDGSENWITRVGKAATMIRQTKGATITDLDAKIQNSLEMDAPHLLSDCIKAAAKQLGNLFGRDENRLFTSGDLDEVVELRAEQLSRKDEVILKIKAAETVADLSAIYAINKDIANDIINELTARKKELSTLQITTNNETV